ncbi:MAG: hypothetical protein ACR2O0_15075 [Rhizobiaceae bacterium]
MNLQTGSVRNIGNVASFEFNETGDLLAYTVAAANDFGNGLYVLELATHVLRPIDSSTADYSRLKWNEEGDQLAALRGNEKEGFTQKENDLIVVQNVASRTESKIVYVPADHESFPENMVISELGQLEFSEDGSMVFTGLKEQRAEPEKDEDDERPNVDVWHWQDDRVQSVQQRRASRERRSTLAAVLHIEQDKLIPLADKQMSRVSIEGKGRWGIGVDDKKYRAEVSWGGSRGDYYRIDLKTGERQPITSALGRPMGYSPDGKWFAFLKGEQLWAHNLDDGKTTNLSKTAPVNFVNEDDDHPYEKPAWGIAGWTEDGESVIVNHRYDLWLIPLQGGTATNLTAGLGDSEQIRFRYVRLDPEEETIDTAKPMLLSAYGDWTKQSGYYTLELGEKPQPLFYEDKNIGRLVKAKDSDRLMFAMQTFEDFPNYWVTNTQFENPLQLTDANPQQAEYFWGRRVLVDYKNSDGVRLQATLALPGNYEQDKKYPMLVYFYEKMSQRHHQYSAPRYDDRPHMSTYASDGYLVLMPDVVYKTGRPGSSALDSEVEAAIQENLFALMEGKTVIAIAHRLSTISQMDRLVVMDKGRIVETGTHDELVKRGGLYSELWARQSGGFLYAEDAEFPGAAQ